MKALARSSPVSCFFSSWVEHSTCSVPGNPTGCFADQRVLRAIYVLVPRPVMYIYSTVIPLISKFTRPLFSGMNPVAPGDRFPIVRFLMGSHLKMSFQTAWHMLTARAALQPWSTSPAPPAVLSASQHLIFSPCRWATCLQTFDQQSAGCFSSESSQIPSALFCPWSTWADLFLCLGLFRHHEPH